MVQDSLRCQELPGVHFSDPKPFEDMKEASVPVLRLFLKHQ